MEYKLLPYFIKELDAKTRTVTGIFAVHGNVDEGGDVSEPGSFAKRLGDGSRKRVRFLWNHISWNPPIASIKSIREVTREELPDKVLAWAPAATGGVEVTRQYYKGVELADWVFQAVEAGDVAEMSYAYQVHEYTIREDETTKREIRVLTDVELFDISDVNWGMNPATAGVKNQELRADFERYQVLLSHILEKQDAEQAKSEPGTGDTFSEQLTGLAASLEQFMARLDERKTFRMAEGRGLSEQTRAKLAEMATEIETILRETEPRADDKAVISEYARFLATEARVGN